MKAKVTIDYESGTTMTPVIKIVTPLPDRDLFDKYDDPRDRLVADFLHTPSCFERNHLFETKTYGNILNNGSPVGTQDITTIGAVPYDRILYTFKHILLNRYVSHEDLWGYNEKACGTDFTCENHIINTINEFFTKIEKLDDLNIIKANN